MYTVIRKRQVYHKLISFVTASFFFLNVFTTDVLALAPQSGVQNPYTRCEYKIACLLRSGQLTFAENPDDIEFLKERNHAKALLLSHGRIIADKDLKNRPEELLRVIVHEQIEAIMQIMSKEEGSKYSTLVNMVLGAKMTLPDKYLTDDDIGTNRKAFDIKAAFARLFPEEAVSRITTGSLDDEILANHVIAKAFELIIARNESVLTTEMSDKERLFLNTLETIINANKHSYFTGVFWDDSVRESKIRIAMANGMSFTQVASQLVNEEKTSIPALKIKEYTESRPWISEVRLDTSKDSVRRVLNDLISTEDRSGEYFVIFSDRVTQAIVHLNKAHTRATYIGIDEEADMAIIQWMSNANFSATTSSSSGSRHLKGIEVDVKGDELTGVIIFTIGKGAPAKSVLPAHTRSDNRSDRRYASAIREFAENNLGEEIIFEYEEREGSKAGELSAKILEFLSKDEANLDLLLKEAKHIADTIEPITKQIYAKLDEAGLTFRFDNIVLYFNPDDHEYFRHGTMRKSGVTQHACLFNVASFMKESDFIDKALLEGAILHEAGYAILDELVKSERDPEAFAMALIEGVDHPFIKGLKFNFKKYSDLSTSHTTAVNESFANWIAMHFMPKQSIEAISAYQLKEILRLLKLHPELTEENPISLTNLVAIAKVAGIKSNKDLVTAESMLGAKEKEFCKDLQKFIEGLSLKATRRSSTQPGRESKREAQKEEKPHKAKKASRAEAPPYRGGILEGGLYLDRKGKIQAEEDSHSVYEKFAELLYSEPGIEDFTRKVENALRHGTQLFFEDTDSGIVTTPDSVIWKISRSWVDNWRSDSVMFLQLMLFNVTDGFTEYASSGRRTERTPRRERESDLSRYYKILKLPDDSAIEEVRKAFRKLALKYHPDMNGGSSQFVPQFREAKDAYEAILNHTNNESKDIGTPAQLLREMHADQIYGDNPKSSLELSGNDMRKGEADSQRTIQRELRYLQDAGVILQIDGKYALNGWLRNIEDIEAFIAENPTLNKASPTPDEITALRKNTAAYEGEVLQQVTLVQGILPKGASKEWTDYIGSLNILGKTASEKFINRALDLDRKAAEYNKEGQSLILYADDILENVTVYDLQYTIKNVLAKHNMLTGGKIVLFARKAANAKILEDMIRWTSPAINTVTITEDQIQSNGNEVKEVEAVTRLARAKGTKDILALIRGPVKDKNNAEPFEAFAKSSKTPLVIVGPDKALYSLAQALSMAMDAKLSDGAKNGWLIMLPPIRSITDDIKRRYEEYQNSLHTLQAA